MNGDIAVIDILRNDATAGALVGGTGVNNARVFPAELPQGETYPAYVVDLYDTEPFDTKTGVSAVDHDLVKVFCYADTVHQAVALQDAARGALDGAAGTYNGKVVDYIRYLKNDGYNTPETNRRIYVREMDFMVRIRTGL